MMSIVDLVAIMLIILGLAGIAYSYDLINEFHLTLLILIALIAMSSLMVFDLTQQLDQLGSRGIKLI